MKGIINVSIELEEGENIKRDDAIEAMSLLAQGLHEASLFVQGGLDVGISTKQLGFDIELIPIKPESPTVELIELDIVIVG